PLPFTKRAYLLQTLGLYDAVHKEVEEALKISPEDFDSYKLLGEMYGIKKNYIRAFENFRIATILRPHDPQIRVSLARAYESLKDYKGAISQYDRVIEVAPKNSKAYYGLAKCYAYLGREKAALNFFRQAKAISPEDKIDVQEIHDIIDKNKKTKKEVISRKSDEIEKIKSKQLNNI
ncbi:MAG: tetratricopeptide repeat protein, partial [Candidatus Omnitrophota bacterium]